MTCEEISMPEIIKINPDRPEQALIDRAVEILKGGGVIAYPTETFYGLGAHAGIQEAVERIFLIKGRAFTNPVALILGDGTEIGRLVVEAPPAAYRLMQAFWPGALTIVFKASPLIIPRLTAGTGKIGIRVSSHPIASILAKTLSFPLTATSANISGAKECSTAGEVVQSLGDRVDAVIDGGKTAGETGSTVLDITVKPPLILREGAVPSPLILAILENN
jgi:L-threonylcarbamoyladenylate synthase